MIVTRFLFVAFFFLALFTLISAVFGNCSFAFPVILGIVSASFLPAIICNRN